MGGYRNVLSGLSGVKELVIVAGLLLLLPVCLDPFRLNLVGKYLTYAFVALGLVLCWGHGGILSLGRGSSSGSAATAWRCF